MFGNIPTINCYMTGHRALLPYARNTSAVSTEAMAITESAQQIVQRWERSQVLFGEKSEAISRLSELAKDCNEADWDGADAAPVDSAAFRNALNLLRALPEFIPMPEFAIDPDGAISLDWIQSRQRIFSLSISASSRMAYAWLDGSDKGHGVASFNGNIVPARVIYGICEIINHG